jgi:serine protease Do
MMRYPQTLFLSCLMLFSAAPNASQLSEDLFARHRTSVFQIRLMDESTHQRAALGSGFCVGSAGFVATNYHVISDSVYEKSRYRIVAIDDANDEHNMQLRAVDVIHDLAVLQLQDAEMALPCTALSLVTRQLPQGEAVFSLGNPLDIGMMVVEGQYNGLVKQARFDQMIFSGNINPGMSGGPSIDRYSELVGVNVASSGDGIGYLVPAKFLERLLDELPAQQQRNLVEVVGEQLLADQDRFYSALLARKWKMQDFFDLTVPDAIDSTIKCWGDSNDEKRRRYESSRIECSGSNDIYILNNKFTGSIEYIYGWIESLDLNRFQLYSQVENTNSFGSYHFADMDASWTKDEVTPFSCKTSFVASGGGTWRLVYCVRGYRDFPGLYDAGLLMVSVDRNDRNLSAEITATGISKDNAKKLTEQFIRSVTWKN